jgi:hypothetical protein
MIALFTADPASLRFNVHQLQVRISKGHGEGLVRPPPWYKRRGGRMPAPKIVLAGHGHAPEKRPEAGPCSAKSSERGNIL